ncbi:MAG: DUF1080 domain-containing protein [Verrucomicrobiota bacterium]
MKRLLLTALLALPLAASAADWVTIFDGKSLDGWKAGGSAESFRIEDGKLVIQGKPMGHLFYVGDVRNHDFKNFELKLEIMTTPGSNGGVYFHTKYQPQGWPEHGFEAQVNATHGDNKKGGGLYGVADITESPAPDNVWWTYHIIVKDKKVTLKVNDKVSMEWTEPEGYEHPQFKHRKLSSGTFALQAHDPKSIVYVRNIRVKPLP